MKKHIFKTSGLPVARNIWAKVLWIYDHFDSSPVLVVWSSAVSANFYTAGMDTFPLWTNLCVTSWSFFFTRTIFTLTTGVHIIYLQTFTEPSAWPINSNTGTTIIDFHLLTCITTLGKYLTAITNLISFDFLHPNASKIEVLVFGPDSFSEEVSHSVVPPPVQIIVNHWMYTSVSSLACLQLVQTKNSPALKYYI